jgi:hypothetical protein
METSSVSKKDLKQILGGFSTPNKNIVFSNPTCGSSCTRQANA